MANFISEDDIEQAVLQKLQTDYGFQHLNCFTANAETLPDKSNRIDKRQVILTDRLRSAVCRLNPDLPDSAIDAAVDQITQHRRAISTIAANSELDALIRNGFATDYENDQGRTQTCRVRFIDFNDTSQNEFLAVSQLWIQGEHGYRRPDILLYINGLPLVFIELKNSNVKLKSAYDGNLNDYKKDIPQLFHANAFCILSNAMETRIGSFNAQWEYFFAWLRIEDEKEKIDRAAIAESATSLERAIEGLCNPAKLLDYIENFIFYHKETQKIIAQNHQFIGVNRAIEALKQRQDKNGKLGVFWHTQGSGKSFSMIFYVRKVFRKLTGNFSFVIITDRNDLARQVYRNFLHSKTIAKNEQV